MKRIGILLLALCANTTVAQQLAVSHWKGEIGKSTAGVYGIKGVNSNAQPGALVHANGWLRNDEFYLFGGNHAHGSGNTDLILNNRIWTYNKTAGWTLVKGDTNNFVLNSTDTNLAALSYGTLGQVAASNLPGARYQAAFATAPNGDLYLYGGYGQASDGAGVLSDLWKFDGTNWTWLSGPALKNQAPVRSTLGQANSSNHPGARKGANLWFDNAGVLHLYGGSHSSYLQHDQNFDDVWTWDGSQWTWITGTSSFESAPVQQGNDFIHPRARHGASGIYATDGYFYMYGGGYSVSNDWRSTQSFWRFDGSNWEFLYGVPLVHDYLFNTPSPIALTNTLMLEVNDSLYLTPGLSPFYGGITRDYYVWRGNTWARLKHTANIDTELNVYKSSNSLGLLSASAYASNGKEAFIYGGGALVHSQYVSARLHGFNGSDFALLDNSPNNIEPQFSSGLPIVPGSRWGSASYYASDEDILYLFGGWGYDESGQVGNLNDLWCYKDNNWIWLSGEKQKGLSSQNGGLGQFDSTYYPSGRTNPVLWKDNGDTLWLFGGLSAQAGSSNQYYSNELWAFYDGQWALMKGQSQTSGMPNYGSKQQASISNTPGGRVRSAVWVNSDGEAYVFGGQGLDENGDVKELNDLWKFNGLNWIWLNGSSIGNDGGNPGVIGQIASSNYPSARQDMAFAGNQEGLYLYGGYGIKNNSTNYLDQLWYFDGNTEEWVLLSGTTTGSNTYLTAGLRPTKNHSTVDPGSITNAHLWADGDELYLYGGRSYSRTEGNFVSHNNLWHWDGSNWAWLKGSKEGVKADQAASQGIPFKPDFKNLPGGRQRGVAWSSGSRFFLFGGEGANTTGAHNDTYLQDVWAFEKGNVWDGQSWSLGSPNHTHRLIQIVSSQSPGNELQCGNLLVDANFQLDMNQNALHVYGDLYNYSTIINQGEIKVCSDSTQSINGNRLEVEKMFVIDTNATLETNDSLVILATSAGDYGQLVPLGTLNGEVEFEYYLTLNSGADNARFYHFGTVLENVSNASLGDGGYYQTGNALSQFNTLWEWDADASNWVSPSNGSNLQNGKGYALYAGNMNGSNFLLSNGQSGKLKLRGTLSSQSNRNIIVGYNDGQNSSVTFAGGNVVSATEGWNLISNPFPHNVDLASILSNLGNQAVYFWDGTNYATWVNGVAVNGGTTVVAPGQGFYIQVSGMKSSLNSINLNRGDVWLNPSSGARFKTNASHVDGLKFQLFAADSLRDEAWIGFNPYATDTFDGAFDAWKILQSQGDFIAVESPDGQLAVANYDPQNFSEAIVSITSGEKHGDSLMLRLDMRNLINGSEPVLEDLKTGHLHFLSNDSIVHFVNDSLFHKRFRFYFHRDLGSQEDSNLDLPFTFYNQGKVFLNTSKPFNLTLNIKAFSSDGRLVEESDWNSSQGAKEILSSVPNGVYTVSIEAANFKHSLQVVKCSIQ